MEFESIDEIVEFYKSLPSQGSAGWLKGRTERLGGSELGTVLGYNKYSSIYDIICEKLELTPPIDQLSINLNWGCFFEPIHTEVLEAILHTQIKQLPSVPWHPEYNSREKLLTSSKLHISPDGIAAIDKDHLLRLVPILETDKSHIHEIINFISNSPNQHLTTIMEQKACITRNPTSIPEYYLPQIMGGMNLFSITELGLFSQSEFRMCDIASIQPPQSPLYLHHNLLATQQRYPRNFDEVIAAGITYIICPTAKAAEFSAAIDITLSDDIAVVCNQHAEMTFIKIARLLKTSKSDEVYLRTVFHAEDESNDEFQARCEDVIGEYGPEHHILALVPWKLFRMVYHFLIPDKNYLYNIEEIIDLFVDGVKECRTKQCDKRESALELKKKITNYLVATYNMHPY